MRTPEHRQAQELDVVASLLFRQGKRAEARARFREAAAFEVKALESIPASKPKTRGIIGVSAAVLLYKSRQMIEAENLIYRLLSEPLIGVAYRQQLRELLEVVWDEQSLPSGMTYSGEEILVSLRGGSVGYGTAPLEMALSKSSEIRNLLFRATEWVRGDKFRHRGPVDDGVVDFVQARATQPSAGSYRFSIRLVEPEQLEMFGPEVVSAAVSAAAVSDAVFGLIRTIVEPSPIMRQQLLELVPDAEYRQALVKLVRNVAPSDGGLGEVEFSRVRRHEGQSEPEREAVQLRREVRQVITELVRQEEAPQVLEASEEKGVLRGILRALHLDEGWLVLSVGGGGKQRCETRENVLDDVVGPMVNRRVLIHGVWIRGRSRFQVIDIDFDDG
ncbi:hypothetical protein OV208_15335 [Corallococcus sp. bb12-1]|uniref:hypothetical protein n=1 Tax=Corallococcus sp. bb12-1 TaxID=2996784 RepID=UPI00226DA5C0|nr:hypothetical protein [Corallococcus sp. bb12-1]MCY1042697.1 hypothetical protein [Corallococcus sp. bb12-1]